MKQEKLFDLLKAAVSPCECVKAAKQERFGKTDLRR